MAVNTAKYVTLHLLTQLFGSVMGRGVEPGKYMDNQIRIVNNGKHSSMRPMKLLSERYAVDVIVFPLVPDPA
jgi:hypothetical protein